jgi:hypothetical protein
MYIIELTLKNTPMPLSVQRKSVEDADAVYQKMATALRSGSSELLELTCDRQPEKKIAVLSSEVCAVQIYEKSSAAASGKAPGFVTLAQ